MCNVGRWSSWCWSSLVSLLFGKKWRASSNRSLCVYSSCNGNICEIFSENEGKIWLRANGVYPDILLGFCIWLPRRWGYTHGSWKGSHNRHWQLHFFACMHFDMPSVDWRGPSQSSSWQLGKAWQIFGRYLTTNNNCIMLHMQIMKLYIINWLLLYFLIYQICRIWRWIF